MLTQAWGDCCSNHVAAVATCGRVPYVWTHTYAINEAASKAVQGQGVRQRGANHCRTSASWPLQTAATPMAAGHCYAIDCPALAESTGLTVAIRP